MRTRADDLKNQAEKELTQEIEDAYKAKIKQYLARISIKENELIILRNSLRELLEEPANRWVRYLDCD